MFACRACRVPLSAQGGCAICAPIKGQLVVVGEDADARPSLAGVANELVAMLRRQITHVEKLLKDDPNSTKAGQRAIALANSTAKVLDSARKLQEDGATVIEHMSFVEQLELFAGWVMGLPPAYRRSVTEKLAEMEVAISRPVVEQPAVEPS